MSDQLHERARRLLAASLVEGVAEEEQRWLDGHLGSCAACARFRQRLDAGLRAIALPEVAVDPRLADAAQRRVHARARERAAAADARLAIAASLIGLAMSALSVWGLWSMLPAWTEGLVDIVSRGYVTTVGVAFVWSLVAAIWLWLLPAALVALALALFNPRPGQAAILVQEVRS
jgi:hypothetical protein